jgi:hypothetical protein
VHQVDVIMVLLVMNILQHHQYLLIVYASKFLDFFFCFFLYLIIIHLDLVLRVFDVKLVRKQNSLKYLIFYLKFSIEYFRCPTNGFYADAYGCAQGKYFECLEQSLLLIFLKKNNFLNFVFLFLAILVSRSCPRGLRFNFFLGRCDYTVNVACPAL